MVEPTPFEAAELDTANTPRIASLVPSLTETLFALGLAKHVVARTGFCIYPSPAVLAVPKVGGTKDVNLAKLAALKPTHVLLNRDENTLATLAAVQALSPAAHILATHPLTTLDNIAVFKQLGMAFDCQTTAQQLCQQFGSVYEAALAKAWQPRRVLYLIWRNPWMTVANNTYISQTLALFGLHTVPSVLGEPVGASRYPAVADLAMCIKTHAIDAVLLSTEPYAFTPAHCVAMQSELNVPVHLINGEHTSWYGSRAIIALPALAEWRSRLAI